MIVFNCFPTHIACSNRKYGRPDFWKINSQGIYNSSISRFKRAIVIDNIHKYLISELEQQEFPKLSGAVILKLDIFIPINYSDVRLLKQTTISWKKASPGYVPRNDEDNVTYIWTKCIKDCLTKLGVWPDDSLAYCRGVNSMIHFIDELEDRKIEVDFIKL